MKVSKKQELFRKILHLSSILIPLSYKYIFNYNKTEIQLILGFLVIIALIIEILRYHFDHISNSFKTVFGKLLRNHEFKTLTGATYLLIACLISITIFPADIAYLIMFFLILGDSSATIIGIFLGKRYWKNSNKSLEGSIAIFIVTFLVAIINTNLLVFALLGSVLATIAELSRIPINDNIKIPLLSGFGMYLFQLL